MSTRRQVPHVHYIETVEILVKEIKLPFVVLLVKFVPPVENHGRKRVYEINT